MVIDTGIFIEHLRAKNKLETVLAKIPDDTLLCVSSVTLFELYSGATSPQKIEDVKRITANLIHLSFSADVAEEAANIYRQLRAVNQLIDMRDIFIAATAVANELPLLTFNRKHFDRISGLRLME